MPNNKAEIIIAAKDLAKKELDDVVKNVKGMTSRSTSHVKKLASAFSSTLGGAIKGAMRMLTSLKTLALASLAGWGLANLAKGFLDTARQTENYMVVLETLLKSASKAKEYFQWIRDFASKTPFKIPGLMEAATRLEAYGLSAKEYMRTLGDTAKSMSKPLMAAVEAVADASQGEYERLKEFGFRAADVAKRAGFETVQAMNSTRENLQKGLETLMVMFDERFKGGMERSTKTLDGMMSNLSDKWTEFKQNVMDAGPYDFIKKKLADVLDKINEWAKDGSLQKWAENAGKAFTDAFKWAEKKVVDLYNEIKRLYNDGTLEKWADDTIMALKPLLTVMEKVADAVRWMDNREYNMLGQKKALLPDSFYNEIKTPSSPSSLRTPVDFTMSLDAIRNFNDTQEINFMFTGEGSSKLMLSEKIAELQGKLGKFSGYVEGLEPGLNIDTSSVTSGLERINSQFESTLANMISYIAQTQVDLENAKGNRMYSYYKRALNLQIEAGYGQINDLIRRTSIEADITQSLLGGVSDRLTAEQYQSLLQRQGLTGSGGSTSIAGSSAFDRLLLSSGNRNATVNVNLPEYTGVSNGPDWRDITRNYIVPELNNMGF